MGVRILDELVDRKQICPYSILAVRQILNLLGRDRYPLGVLNVWEGTGKPWLHSGVTGVQTFSGSMVESGLWRLS